MTAARPTETRAAEAGREGEARRQRCSLARGLAIAFASLVLLLVLGEVAAQVYITRIADLDTFGRFASLGQVLERQVGLVPFIRHRYLGYYPAPGFDARGNRHDALGYRGADIAREKPAGAFRIACIGGSTTYGMGAKDWRHAYPTLLQDELRARGHESVEVINAGCNGWCTCESLINLELRVLELEPDLLLVYHSANDIHARFVWPPERYLGDNSGFRIAASELIVPSVLEHSALYRIVAVSNDWMTPHAGIERNISQQPEWCRSSDFRVQRFNQVYPKGIFAEVSADEMLRVNAPVYYRRNLTGIVRTGRARGMEVVLVSFVYNTFDPRSLSASPTYVAAYAEHEAVQQQIAAAEGARYFDLKAAFPLEERYFVDDMHMTEAGNRVKARLFADHLELERLLP